jgi:hypothetical protein
MLGALREAEAALAAGPTFASYAGQLAATTGQVLAPSTTQHVGQGMFQTFHGAAAALRRGLDELDARSWRTCRRARTHKAYSYAATKAAIRTHEDVLICTVGAKRVSKQLQRRAGLCSILLSHAAKRNPFHAHIPDTIGTYHRGHRPFILRSCPREAMPVSGACCRPKRTQRPRAAAARAPSLEPPPGSWLVRGPRPRAFRRRRRLTQTVAAAPPAAAACWRACGAAGCGGARPQAQPWPPPAAPPPCALQPPGAW